MNFPKVFLVAIILSLIILARSDGIFILDDRAALITSKAFLAFFNDTRIVSFIMTQDEIDSLAYQKYKAAMYNAYHFTFYDFTIKNMTDDYRLPGTALGMMPHSNAHSYIVSSEVMFGNEEIAHKLFKQNPNAKWAVTMTRIIDDDGVLAFYRKYWDMFKMAFLFTLDTELDLEFPDNIINNITYSKFEKLRMYLFNPFEINDNDGKRGTVTKIYSTQMKSKEDWDKIYYFYRNLIDDLHQSTLKVVLGADDLLVGIESENNFVYPDGELFMMLMKKMNFKITRQSLGKDSFYGGVWDNGSITGLTRQLEYNELDIVGNSRPMTDLRTNNTLFLYPYISAKTIFMMKKKIPKDIQLTVVAWQNYSYPLNYFHILVFILSILFLALTEIFFQWKLCDIQLRMHQMVVIVIDAATLIYGFLEESSIPLKKWSKMYQRLFLFGIILYSMLLTSVFKGNIVKDLSIHLVSEDPLYVSQIVESSQGLVYYEGIHNVYRKYVNDTDLIFSKLSKRRVICYDGLINCCWSLIKHDRIMIIRENYAMNMRAKFWDNVTGTDLFHIVPEAPFSFVASITVNKGSPYVNKLNDIITRCTEAGIINHGIATADHSLRLSQIQRYRNRQFVQRDTKNPINLKNIHMVILVFLTMLFISTLVFLCEILVHKLMRKSIETK